MLITLMKIFIETQTFQEDEGQEMRDKLHTQRREEGEEIWS